jgi:hypothetical protein
MSPAATAAARRAAAEAAPARRPARRRPARRAPARAEPRRGTSRRAPRRAPATHIIPGAAAMTAGAVGDIADSGLIVRLTRGRLWIAVLATLLAGIVALNVFSLSFSTSASKVAERSARLERDNSVLRAELAKKLSSERVEAIAAGLGLEVPAPRDIVYLSVDGRDPEVAARRLQSGELGGPADLATTPTTTTDGVTTP